MVSGEHSRNFRLFSIFNKKMGLTHIGFFPSINASVETIRQSVDCQLET